MSFAVSIVYSTLRLVSFTFTVLEHIKFITISQVSKHSWLG